MNKLFVQVLTLSLSASVIAGLVMLLRLILKKAPRGFLCALWALVAIRLLIPNLPESRMSVVPQRMSEGSVIRELSERPVETTVRVKENEAEYVTILEKHPAVKVQQEAATGERYVEVSRSTGEAPKTVSSQLLPVAAWIWLGGAVLMLAYMVFSYLRIGRKVRISMREEGNVYICDEITSPFILGVLRPRIYLPSDLNEKDRAYVLAHEEAHLKRLDHFWKPFAFILLALYWFNPVMWAAYILLCRDIELACDEKVIGREGAGYRRAYSEALLACSMPQRLVTACPLAFGEVGVKVRIQSVLNYRKPAFWLMVLAALACVAAVGCSLTNPSTDPAAPLTQESTTPAPAALTTTAAPAALATTAVPETKPTKVPQILDLRDKEAEIQAGLIYAVNGGKPLESGLDFILSGSDSQKTRQFSIREGTYRDGSTGWELYLNDKELGYSSLWERIDQQVKSAKTNWEREMASRVSRSYSFTDVANFTKECSLYLVSLDGKTISLAIGGPKEVIVTNGSKVRLRGEGKGIEDLKALRPLAEYIADGWEVRPQSGDELDLDGDGKTEKIYVSFADEMEKDAEVISIDIASFGHSDVCYMLYQPKDADTAKVLFAYDRLYYSPNEKGGYDIKGEVLAEGAKHEAVWEAVPTEDGKSLKLVEKAELPEEERAVWQEYLSHPMLPYLLCGSFDDPAGIDLYRVFFNGVETADGQRFTMSEEEEKALVAKYPQAAGLFNPICKVPVKEANALLQQFLGMDLSSMDMAGMEKFWYLPEYESYYSYMPEGGYTSLQLEGVTHMPDGSIELSWKEPSIGEGTTRLVQQGDAWVIASNKVVTKP